MALKVYHQNTYRTTEIGYAILGIYLVHRFISRYGFDLQVGDVIESIVFEQVYVPVRIYKNGCVREPVVSDTLHPYVRHTLHFTVGFHAIVSRAVGEKCLRSCCKDGAAVCGQANGSIIRQVRPPIAYRPILGIS